MTEQDYYINQLLAKMNTLTKALWDSRNELCLKCNKYHNAYQGACSDCRWNFDNMDKLVKEVKPVEGRR